MPIGMQVAVSDLLARLCPEAAGLAWLGNALAHPNVKPGQGRQSRLALAWLRLEPRLGAGCGGMQAGCGGVSQMIRLVLEHYGCHFFTRQVNAVDA